MKKVLFFLLFLILPACGTYDRLSIVSTPPGWRSLVSDLLLDDGAFPEGWVRERDSPKDSLNDPTINHVYRSWWGQAKGHGGVEQSIWRAYKIADAEELYEDLRGRQFLEGYTPPPDESYAEFRPPHEINFQSKIADEFYIACGWRAWGYCQVLARYRNYVTYMKLDLDGQYKGYTTIGLTYLEIETILNAMDAKFAEFLSAFPLATSSP